MPETQYPITPIRAIAMILAYSVLRKKHARQNGVDLAISPNHEPLIEEINEAKTEGSIRTSHIQGRRSTMYVCQGTKGVQFLRPCLIEQSVTDGRTKITSDHARLSR